MAMDNKFSHLNKDGIPLMVDVTAKKASLRTAKAYARITISPEIIAAFRDEEIHTKKGPVFQTAILAGIMGAKKTSDLIPLCHPLALDNCTVDIKLDDDDQIIILCTATITAKTGVEMEALTGASVAALTIYDMCKSFSHDIVINEIRLLNKKGGKSDFEHQ